MRRGGVTCRVSKPPKEITRDAEADRFMAEFDGRLRDMLPVLERNFVVLHNRSQLLLVLAGVVVSTVGFSGRLVAGTNAWAQGLVVAGVSLVLLSAATVSWAVLHLRWLTMQPGGDTRSWLMKSLAYRDKKTKIYRASVLIMLIGLACYAGALSIMLLNPEEDALPSRTRVADRSVTP